MIGISNLFPVGVILALVVGDSFAAEKPRLLVLTDMGADPDDQQSMVRLLLYANEFEIEGLIATSAGTTGKREQHVTHPEMIRELVTAYGEVRPNLVKHAAGYPTAEQLLAKIKVGSSQRGKEAIGEGRDTEASQWIIAVVDKPDPRPLCISIWGGQTDLGQALWRVKQDRGEEGLKEFVARLRIYDVADQDGLASWIQEMVGMVGTAHPTYVQAGAPAGRDKREGVFRGMYLGGDESLVSREWMETNIRQNHGPLGALYPPKTWTAPNPHAAIKEGDTPSWLYFLPHGLNDIEHPEWGGFGGRFERGTEGVYRDARDAVGDVSDARATVWRWRSAVQADFQTRLNWCVADKFEKANHAPVAVVNGDRSREVVRIQAKAGEMVTLSAAGSSDVDGNAVRYRWFIYREASLLGGEVTLAPMEGVTTRFSASRGEAATVHVILEVNDAGSPPLAVFRRVVVAAGE
ncbi:MAG TPA: nucleoside hydrolase-like domain-containing protein [Pirellulaceae bacterium]